MLIGGAIWLAIVGGLAWLYVLPSLIAFRRRHRHRWVILIVDVMFGASVVGWLWALFWALRAPRLSAASGGNASALDMLTDDVRALVLASPAVAAPSPGPVSAATAVQEIERLAALHAAGHLTAPEFATLKAAVLQQI
jgi:hypothetical protein